MSAILTSPGPISSSKASGAANDISASVASNCTLWISEDRGAAPKKQSLVRNGISILAILSSRSAFASLISILKSYSKSLLTG